MAVLVVFHVATGGGHGKWHAAQGGRGQAGPPRAHRDGLAQKRQRVPDLVGVARVDHRLPHASAGILRSRTRRVTTPGSGGLEGAASFANERRQGVAGAHCGTSQAGALLRPNDGAA